MATTTKLGDPLQLDTHGVAAAVTVRMVDGTEHRTSLLSAEAVARASRDEADMMDARAMARIRHETDGLHEIARRDVRLTQMRLSTLRYRVRRLTETLDSAELSLLASHDLREFAAQLLPPEAAPDATPEPAPFTGREEVEW